MTDDELKAIWKVSKERIKTVNLNTLKVNYMNEQIKKFEQTVRRRNNQEIIVAIGLIVWFGIYAYIKPEPLAKVGALFIVLYCLNVIYQLRRTESKQPNFDMMRSMKEQLVDYQKYVKAEQKLLTNVLYWYLLPMLPGLILFLIGTGVTLTQGIIYFGVVVPLGFSLVAYMNKQAVLRRTRPLLEDIAKTLDSLEEVKN